MRIFNPITSVRGIDPNNLFVVENDKRQEMGKGYIFTFVRDELFPNQPLQLYIDIQAEKSVYNLLYGALIARADVLRSQYPNIPARLYTKLNVNDTDKMNFFLQKGLQKDDAEDVYSISLHEWMSVSIPNSLQYHLIPLNSMENENMFLRRMNRMCIGKISQKTFSNWKREENFLALGFYQNGTPVTELIIKGEGRRAELVILYTNHHFRHRGYAKALLRIAIYELMKRNVTQLNANVLRRHIPQVELIKSMKGVQVATSALMPGMDF